METEQSRYPRLTKEEFHELISRGFFLLPEKFRMKIKNVALLAEDEPSKEVRAREGLAPNETLLGYYQGIPHTARGADYGIGPTMPDTITLYQNPITEEARDTGEPIERVIADTIWHEVAHYFGYDEPAVAEREHVRLFHRDH